MYVFIFHQIPEWYLNSPHPLWWLKLFKHDLTGFYSGTKATDELSIPGLAKLLMYGNFAQARVVAESKTVREIVEGELDMYPYSRKKNFHEPYFTPIDLSLENTDFKPALTDAGICQVYNGDSLDSSFASSTRNDELRFSLDPRQGSSKPKKINGTGKISQITMWLDARNKYQGSEVDSFEKEAGNLMVAINSWQTYYDVRINQLDLRAGTDVIIKIKPLIHTTSAAFRNLNLKDRKCRFMDEQEVLPHHQFIL